MQQDLDLRVFEGLAIVGIALPILLLNTIFAVTEQSRSVLYIAYWGSAIEILLFVCAVAWKKQPENRNASSYMLPTMLGFGFGYSLIFIPYSIATLVF